MSRPWLITTAMVLLALAGGCRLHDYRDFEAPPLEVPDTWARAEGAGSERPARWWSAFGDAELEALVERSLDANLDLRQAWSRIDQALARVENENASVLPAVSIDGNARFDKSIRSTIASGAFIGGSPAGADTHGYSVSPRLSYEIDLWGRLAARRDARTLELEATVEDLLGTGLVLAAEVTEAWLDLLEQRSLASVLEAQIETGTRQLELVELRFANGQANALDVLQQRQQVARIVSQRPDVARAAALAENRLAILCGRAPSDAPAVGRPGLDLVLPPLPSPGHPGDLLDNRPDLRAARARLRAADRDVAEAVADRMPRLDLSLSYQFSATRGGAQFDREILDGVLSLLAPVFDNGLRSSEIDRREARVRELLDAFRAAYLVALREVEDALVGEARPRARLAALERELALADETLGEARARYAGGVAEYLNVLTSLETRQGLERTLVSERRELLGQRVRLYRALGGAGLEGLRRPDDLEIEGEPR
ncbi:MAG: TolC family protein [Planctomycetota bacterium]